MFIAVSLTNQLTDRPVWNSTSRTRTTHRHTDTHNRMILRRKIQCHAQMFLLVNYKITINNNLCSWFGSHEFLFFFVRMLFIIIIDNCQILSSHTPVLSCYFCSTGYDPFLLILFFWKIHNFHHWFCSFLVTIGRSYDQ